MTVGAMAPQLPRSAARLVHVAELLLFLEGVHHPEPVVAVPEELMLLDEPSERLVDELVSRVDVVKQLSAERKIAAVDREV
jgi:hypothetical protein